MNSKVEKYLAINYEIGANEYYKIQHICDISSIEDAINYFKYKMVEDYIINYKMASGFSQDLHDYQFTIAAKIDSLKRKQHFTNLDANTLIECYFIMDAAPTMIDTLKGLRDFNPDDVSTFLRMFLPEKKESSKLTSTYMPKNPLYSNSEYDWSGLTKLFGHDKEDIDPDELDEDDKI